MPKGTGNKATKPKNNPVVEESANMDDLDLDGIDFDSITDPDASPDVPGVDDDAAPPWDDSGDPEVPGEEDLDLGDIGVPSTEGAEILAEYLPALRDGLETLQGQVSDFHEFHKQRADSQLAAYKAIESSLGNRIDALETKVHELVSLFRTFVQAGGAQKLEDLKHQDAVEPAKAPATKAGNKPAAKEPPPGKLPSIAAVAQGLGLPNLPQVLGKLNSMPEGKTMTIDQLKKWLTDQVKLPGEKVVKLLELFKVKGPITNKTFQPG